MGPTSDHPWPHDDADSILRATAAAAPPAGEAVDDAAPRTLRRRAWLLLAAAALILGAWLAASGLLHVLAQRERDRAAALLRADREIAELTTLRWQTLLGTIDVAHAARTAAPHEEALRRAVQDAHAPDLARAFTAMARRATAAVRDAGDEARSPAAIAADPVVEEIRTFDRALDRRLDASDGVARRDARLAWELSAAGGVLALLLVAALLAAVRRTARAARRVRMHAARTEGERRALAESERRFRALVEHASDVVVVLDAAGRITFATDSTRELLGATPEQLAGRRFADLGEGAAPDRLDGLLDEIRGRRGAVSAELLLRHALGHPVPAEVRVADRTADPDVAGYVLTLRDMGEQRRLQRQLRADAVRDRSTGLPNRLRFTEWLDQALTEVAGGEAPIATVLLDLDDFGGVNDSLGPASGDRLLAAVAERLRGVVGDRGRLARIAGDEFALLLEGIRDPEVAEAEARRLLDALAAPVRLDNADVPLTASLGVALATPGASGEDLLRSAETALHAAKRRGAAQVQVFTPAMHARAKRRLELRSELAFALERGGLGVAYQPVVITATGEVAGLEALARWRLGGVDVTPADFIPLAEASGLIGTLGEQVLERACLDVVGRRRPDGTQVDVGVNVSAVQLRDPGFAAMVLGTLERTGMPAKHLVLELTESAMVDDAARADGALRELRRHGIRLAVDDFGTGWSSLAALASLPVDVLKVDRSFVAAMDGSPTHAALLEGIVAMGAHLGLTTVVEGIETEAQLERVRGYGATLVQGFLLGAPGPLTAARAARVA